MVAMRTKTLLACGAVGAPLFVVAFALAGVGFDQAEGLVDVAGLFQRVTLVTGWAWLTLLAVHLIRSLPGEAGADRPQTGAGRAAS